MNDRVQWKQPSALNRFNLMWNTCCYEVRIITSVVIVRFHGVSTIRFNPFTPFTELWNWVIWVERVKWQEYNFMPTFKWWKLATIGIFALCSDAQVIATVPANKVNRPQLKDKINVSGLRKCNVASTFWKVLTSSFVTFFWVKWNASR